MSPWTTLSFEASPVNGLPLNWQQYNSDKPNASFAVTASPSSPALSGTKSFTVSDLVGSGDISRAWLDQTMPADVQVSAAVYLNSSVPAQVIARGSNLDGSGSGANFYAVQLSPGPALTLVKDVNGTPMTLASVTSSTYVQNAWLEETLDVEGSTVRAQLFNPNNDEYLNSSGQWQSGQTWALTVIDNSVTGPGVVGLGRPALYAGTVTFDDFSVQAPAADQSFDATPAGSLPDNWSKYSSNGGDSIAVTAPASPIAPLPSAPNALAINAVGSGDVARAWLNSSLPADLSASAYAYIAATPAQVFARGSNLSSTTPSYYAVEVWRGGGFKLVKVVNGVETALGSVTSKSYIDNMWVQETLGLSGTTLEAQLYRPDTQQYMDSNGNWQSTPTWAFQNVTDSSIGGGGQEGVGRPVVQEYVDTNYFDDFTTATSTDAQDFDASTSLPFGWQQWSSDKGYNSTYFSVAAAPDNNHFLSASNVLENTGTPVASQLWNGGDWLTNAQVSVGMYLPSGGTQVIARGTNLGTTTPNYYGLSVTPTVTGLKVDLVRVNAGAVTQQWELAPLSTDATYFSSQWIEATLYIDGTNVRAQIYRADTGQYLNSEDLWQSAPAYALDVNDTDPQALTGPGYVGLVRPSGSGTVYFDNFSVTPLSVENTSPAVSISVPGGTLTGPVTVTATPSSNFGISKVDFYVEDGATVLTHWEETTGPYSWNWDTTFVPNGTHTLVVQAYDNAGNVGTATTSVTVSNNTTLTTPNITRHQSNIGIVELSYADPPNGITSVRKILKQGRDRMTVRKGEKYHGYFLTGCSATTRSGSRSVAPTC
ncbi:MAG TPA: Ig-like domain-containing protein, partial [Gemmataceae bacterium]